ncbi:MAG: hypothetical protein M1820_001545 [Bogoriella megaspora]|nr:MAG: hypothetical protein M1820_001545 [Bogoriella megaspora]
MLCHLTWLAKSFPCTAALSENNPGCGQLHLITGFPEPHTIQSSGIDRTYLVHAPSDYANTQSYPLVMGFHGSGSVGLFFEVDSDFDNAKYSGNKIMVYPDGINGSWAGPSYADTTVDQDLQFVQDVLDDVRSKYCIDDSRIYATGMSNGGGFVDTLACNDTVGGEFAAFAPASGAFYTDLKGPDNDCKPARSMTPILEIHGGDDKTVDYDGGEGNGGKEPPIADWVSWWAERNGCSQDPSSNDSSSHGDVHHLSWDCQGVEGLVQHWKVDDMGHQWASTETDFSQIADGDKPTHINASSIIMDFFDGFSKPT